MSIEYLPLLSCMSEDTAREWTKAPEASILGPPETALELPAAVLGYGGVAGIEYTYCRWLRRCL